jgi:hypothetical protein
LIKVFIDKQNGNPARVNRKRLNTAIKNLLTAMNPNNLEQDNTSVDCCICLNSMAPFQALFLAPCSHCFHYTCVTPLLGQGFMFQCPMCRQVANLEANIATDDLSGSDEDEDMAVSSDDDPARITPLTLARSNTAPEAASRKLFFLTFSRNKWRYICSRITAYNN